jgi:uncharacterized protein (TIGR00266 family)
MSYKINKKHSKKKSKRVLSDSYKKTRSNRDLILTKHLKPYKPDNSASHIPDYNIYHKPSNASIVMNIKEGQSVFANAGLMVWMDDNLRVSTKTRGLFTAFKRALLTTDSFFLTSYSGVSPKGNKICFAPLMTGDIVEVRIKPGEKKLVASYGVVVCTDNIILDTRMRLRGIFVSEAPFLSELSVPADSKEYGVAWLSAYGGIETLDVKAGQTIKVENGHFLSCDGDVQYDIGTIGGVKSSIFSGEGFVMVFDGPCKINIQSRNSHALLKWFLDKVPNSKSK